MPNIKASQWQKPFQFTIKVSVVVLETEPLVPVTVNVKLCGGGDEVDPPPPPPQEHTPTTRSAPSNISIKRRCFGFLLHPTITTPNKPAKTKGKLRNGCGARRALAVLETVTVSGTEVVVALRVAGLGLTAQFAPVGWPVQLKLTCPAKPPTPFRVTL